ncbi:MAG TPA: hypothetical protein VFV65_04915 [Gemmatimonadales bacterium]|nr:hypothetical protein [Gemmatimonadales bacterium]
MQGLTCTRSLRLGAALLLAAAVGACSDDDNGGGGGPAASTSYVGLVASSDGQTGPLNLTFASAVAAPPIASSTGTGPSFSVGAVVNVTGTMQLGGGALTNIAGTLDDDDVLNMSGGGYNLFGDLVNGVVTGGFTGPGVSGTMVAAANSESAPARAFCGTFSGTSIGDPPSEDSGTFNLVVAAGTANGVAYDDEGQAIPLQGTSTSSSVSISLTDADSGGTLTATGDYDATGIEGTYTVKLGGVTISSGSFFGGICGSPT